MLRISYKNRKTVFQYRCSRAEAPEQLAMHMANWRFETVKDENGDEIQREVPASEIVAEWVDGQTATPVPVPDYKGPPPKR